MTSLPLRRYPVGSRIRKVDNEGGTHIMIQIESKGAFP